MPYKEKIAVYYKDYIKQIHTLRGKNKKLLNVKSGGTYTGPKLKSGSLGTRTESDQRIFRTAGDQYITVPKYPNTPS
jgi:hypothetical protein